MTPYQVWTEQLLNDHIKDKTLTVKVTKQTRAGKDGKFIVCPQCDQGAYVFHFSWSALSCQHCDTMIDKYDWKLL